jgi:hypothetical protein
MRMQEWLLKQDFGPEAKGIMARALHVAKGSAGATSSVDDF